MRVEFRPEARAQIVERKRWWQEHRREALLRFDEELRDSIEWLRERPTSARILFVRDGFEFRRWLMPTVRCHLYYFVDEVAGVVHVVAAWGARRGTMPPVPPTYPR